PGGAHPCWGPCAAGAGPQCDRLSHPLPRLPGCGRLVAPLQLRPHEGGKGIQARSASEGHSHSLAGASGLCVPRWRFGLVCVLAHCPERSTRATSTFPRRVDGPAFDISEKNSRRLCRARGPRRISRVRLPPALLRVFPPVSGWRRVEKKTTRRGVPAMSDAPGRSTTRSVPSRRPFLKGSGG